MSKYVSAAVPISSAAGIKVNTSLPCSTNCYDSLGGRTVSYIVMHYTGNTKDTAKANANYFHGANVEASAHYFVDDDSIYQSVSPRDRAWHCGASTYCHSTCRNSNSIGIEMCCTAGNYKMSAKTIANAAALCAAWCKLLGIGANEVDTYVLRHYDITHKTCPAPFVNDSAAWTAFKAQVKALLGGSAAAASAAKTTTAAAKTTTAKTTNTEVCEVTLPKLSKGANSGYVKTAQILLNKYNSAGLAEDGGFGAKTYAAVVAYQKSRKLTVDGVIGAQTWGQLLK